MANEQQMVEGRKAINRLLADGWRVVPGTVVGCATTNPYGWGESSLACVVEREYMPAIKPKDGLNA